MLHLDFESLSLLGLTPALAARALATEAAWSSAVPESRLRLVRIVDVHRESVDAADGRGACRAQALPRAMRELASEGTTLCAGDWALAQADTHGQCWIVARVPPLAHIARRDADGRRHPVVSNVDLALLVMGLDDDFNLRRLERYLTLVQGEGIDALVVLTKRDVVVREPGRFEARLAEIDSRLPRGVAHVAVDATHPAAAEALRPWVARGRTLVMLGSSGAGKSTLTNTLLGANVQDTGAVRESDGRGMHTTTSRSLHRLPGGACVIDTPGVRSLQPDGGGDALRGAFADIASLAAQCRFRDCRHEAEPECAVRDGVDADRLRNYRKLLREMSRGTAAPHERQARIARWKARQRAADERARIKRGESIG